MGFGMFVAMRYGIARGIYANEAGYGTAAVAYGTAQIDEPVAAGTAGGDGSVHRLVRDGDDQRDDDPGERRGRGVDRRASRPALPFVTSTAAVATAFNAAMPTVGGWIVAFCAFLFGYTTLIGWAYYGEQFLEYILGRSVTMPYRWIYCLLIPFGAVLRPEVVWAWGDLMNALQVFPNLIGLVGLSGIAAAYARRLRLDLRSTRARRAVALNVVSPLDRPARRAVRSLDSMSSLPALTATRTSRSQAALSRMLAEYEAVGARHGAPADATTTRTYGRAAPAARGGRTTRRSRRRWTRGCAQRRCARAASTSSTRIRPKPIAHALGGRNVVVVTPTASGKTLCYNAPVLDSDPERSVDARAVPVSDQGARAGSARRAASDGASCVGAEGGGDIGVFTYDGDTPQDARRAIRGRAHVVLSNPDMLHSGILPHHPRWAKLFENLQFVVIDELHAYRGVFGSHLANIMRRLQRVCRHYGSDPTFICSSATIANPRELAERLIGAPFELVEQSGAPRGEKFFLFVNPPVVNAQLGIRRSYLAETRRVAIEFLKRGLQLIVFAQSRLSTEILTTYLKDAFQGPPGRGRCDSRLSRRLSAAAAPRDRARAAQRRGPLRGVDQRARAGHRHRRARRRGDGRAIRARSRRRGSAPAAPAADRADRRPCSSRRARRSISSSSAIPTTSSARRPSTRSSIRTTCTSCSIT